MVQILHAILLKLRMGVLTYSNKEVSVSDLSLTLSNSGTSNAAVREYSFDIHLYAHVNGKIRAKIWADEFVDLARWLLHPSLEDHCVLAIHSSGEHPTLTLNLRKKKIYTHLNDGQWHFRSSCRYIPLSTHRRLHIC